MVSSQLQAPTSGDISSPLHSPPDSNPSQLNLFVSLNPSDRLAALRQIKNAIIGNNKKKKYYIASGLVETLVDLLKNCSPEEQEQSVVILGSLVTILNRSRTEEVVRILEGLVNSDSAYSAIRGLKSCLEAREINLLESTLQSLRVLLSISESKLILSSVCSIFSLATLSDDFKRSLVPLLLNLFDHNKSIDSALNALANCIDVVNVGEVLPALLRFVKHPNSQIRLSASHCLTLCVLSNCPKSDASKIHLILLPTLIKLFSNPFTQQTPEISFQLDNHNHNHNQFSIVHKSILLFSMLVCNDQSLQIKVRECDGISGLISILQFCFKNTSDASESHGKKIKLEKREGSEEEIERLKQAVFIGLAAVSFQNRENRNQILDSCFSETLKTLQMFSSSDIETHSTTSSAYGSPSRKSKKMFVSPQKEHRIDKPLVAAACLLLRTLSRSVKNLRTKLMNFDIVPLIVNLIDLKKYPNLKQVDQIDGPILMDFETNNEREADLNKKLENQRDLLILENVLALFSNLVLEFSPLAKPIIDIGGVQRIVDLLEFSSSCVCDKVVVMNVQTSNGNGTFLSGEFPKLRINRLSNDIILPSWSSLNMHDRRSCSVLLAIKRNCIHALKNLAYKSDMTTKGTIMSEMGWDNLRVLMQSDDEEVRELSFNLVRNFGGKREDVDFILSGLGKENLREILRQGLQNESDKIVLQTIYILVHIANGSEQHKSLITGGFSDSLEDGWLLSMLLTLLEILESSHIERIGKLRDFGFENKLKELSSTSDLVLRDRVKSALSAFSGEDAELPDSGPVVNAPELPQTISPSSTAMSNFRGIFLGRSLAANWSELLAEQSVSETPIGTSSVAPNNTLHRETPDEESTQVDDTIIIGLLDRNLG
ncbi:Armadillo repeat-containing protein 8 [Nowakowskiella sp. JEL0407]|nr:Armadillo repeat-containing protein 8 [Nowakowskiella sp. JEL0407]